MEKGVVGVWAEAFQEGILWRIRIDDSANYTLELGETGSKEWAALWRLGTNTQTGRTVFNIEDDDCGKYYRIEGDGDLSVFDEREKLQLINASGINEGGISKSRPPL